jgi:hypothetical protein
MTAICRREMFAIMLGAAAAAGGLALIPDSADSAPLVTDKSRSVVPESPVKEAVVVVRRRRRRVCWWRGGRRICRWRRI